MATELQRAIHIYEGQDFYVPAFEVRITGRPLSRDVVRDVVQVTYRDSLTDIDAFDINVFNEWDPAQPDAPKQASDAPRFKYSDQSIFDPGQTIEILMGYMGKDPKRRMLTGQITSLKPSFPSSGQSMLSVGGLNVLHALRTKQRSEPYINMTDSAIARKIITRLGLEPSTPNLDNESENEYLLQDNQCDIVFLMQRARRIGYDLFVSESLDARTGKPVIVFGPSADVKRTIYKLAYGRSLIDFQPSLTTHNQVSSVEVRAWNRVKKELIVGKAKRAQLDTRSLSVKDDQQKIEGAFAAREEIIADRIVHSQAEADTLAKSYLDQISKDMIKATGSTMGLPDLRAGSVIFLEGLGRRFSGRYFVTATTHTIDDSGYKTQFECRKEELN